jgi:hypothetical protein
MNADEKGKKKGFQRYPVEELNKDDDDFEDWLECETAESAVLSELALKKAAENKQGESIDGTAKDAASESPPYGKVHDRDDDGMIQCNASYKPRANLPGDERRSESDCSSKRNAKIGAVSVRLLNHRAEGSVARHLFIFPCRMTKAAQRVYLYMKGPTVDPNTKVQDGFFW